MPTLPPPLSSSSPDGPSSSPLGEPSSSPLGEPPSPEPHRHRGVAESFGVDPARYDRTRPPYPAELISRIVAASPGPAIVDVGCGTGTAARQLRAAGATVLGVEPDERMAAFAVQTGVPVEVATFEAWSPGGRQFDAVVAGTAWHWVDPAAGAVKAASVLRPGGLLAPFWHVFEPPAEIAQAFADAFRQAVPDSPFTLPPLGSTLTGYQLIFDKAADGMRATGAFGPSQEWRFAWSRVYTRDEWLDQLPTTGALTRVAPAAVAQLSEAVGEAIDALGGSFTMQYTTVAVTATRLTGRLADRPPPGSLTGEIPAV